MRIGFSVLDGSPGGDGHSRAAWVSPQTGPTPASGATGGRMGARGLENGPEEAGRWEAVLYGQAEEVALRSRRTSLRGGEEAAEKSTGMPVNSGSGIRFGDRVWPMRCSSCE